MKTILFSLSILFSLFALTSCDSALNCLDDDGPEFHTKVISDAFENLEYEQEIIAAVDNEPRDDKFDYEFTFQGDLPEGVFFETFGYSRRARLKGTPLQAGTYNFRLTVRVYPAGNHYASASDTLGLCYTTHSEEFTLVVLPEIQAPTVQAP